MTNEVIVIENLNPVEAFKAGGIKPIIDAIRDEVIGEVPDLATKKGRDRIASLAHKVAKSKTALDKAGKAIADDLNAQLKPINAERKLARDELDKLKEEIRQPLTDWENAEKDRQAKHEGAINAMYGWNTTEDFGKELTADELKSHLRTVQAIELGGCWEEYAQQAAETKDKCISELKLHIEKREAYEVEQAELERLRKEAAEREQKEREERIAHEAAEKAKQEAEAKSKAEADRVEREKKEALQREQQLKLEAEQAENRRIEQEEQAKRDAEAAEQKRLADIESAKQEEIARQEQEKRQAEEEARKREANKAHKKAINNNVVQALMQTGISEDQAKQVVIMLNKGQVPHVQINY